MGARKLNDAAWTQDQAIRKVRRCLQSGDDDGLRVMMRAFNRFHCWREAIDKLKTGPSPNKAKGGALISFWNDLWHVQYSRRGLGDDLPHLVDAFKYLLPPYTGQGLTLYRGELESRHTRAVYGISWTPHREKAEDLQIGGCLMKAVVRAEDRSHTEHDRCKCERSFGTDGEAG